MSFSKVICVVDDDVDVQNVGEVAWRLLANLDPKRDLSFVDGPIDQLDHGANQALFGGEGLHRRDAEVEGRGVHARVARGPPRPSPT
jgi:3-polyprenyl-4-hydroxybenzoate decarboxylase